MIAKNRLIAAGLGCLGAVWTCRALPPGFIDTAVPSNFNQAVGLTSSPSGRIFVWEKAGRVWTIDGGVQSSQPLIDLREEVGDWRDHGMLGFALDPAFETNGLIYLMYVVDYHHASTFGTPQYNPATNVYFRDTIGRITRYQCDPATGFTTVLPASRQVLIGATLQSGLPIMHQSHGVGSLNFGADGSLLATFGDSASYDKVDDGGPNSGSSNTALAEGIITATEDVGAFRAQLVNSHAGKVLRIDPATGLGLPGNPFFDPLFPGEPRSRVWALGLRNPFRASLRPGTGSANPQDANPGVLFIGDVGWQSFEELSVCTGPARNFGWPLYEGLTAHPSYQSIGTLNQQVPNPLANGGSCPAFLPFAALLVQDTLAVPSWPNPCNPAVQIPQSLPRFMHTRPAADWRHWNALARVPSFNGTTASNALIGAPGSPVAGPQFWGNSSTGGVWYTGADFPPEFRDVYFHGDFVGGWVRAFVFDAQNRLQEVRNFMNEGEAGAIVAMATNPVLPGLFYINYDEQGVSRLRRVQNVANNNLPPVAQASATPPFGPSPHEVVFSSAGSFDPEAGPLSYSWDFGDGSPASNAANPVHVYRDETNLTAQGTIIARVLELSPPGPQGSGNRNPEIIRDGDFPPQGLLNSSRQFDTFHFGDQGTLDWIGYSFAGPRSISGVLFQEGMHFFDGGWFDLLRVQYRDGIGAWLDVPGQVVTPVYAGNDGVSFDSYRFDFPPISTTGIRIAGVPGGSARFISVGELQVFGPSPAPGQPRRFDATLTVCDNAQQCTQATLSVWINNTPPQITITSPVDGSFYQPSATFAQALRAAVSDAEHAGGTLSCQWQTVLHHNDHTHPEPIDPNCESSALITPHGTSGDTFFWEFVLTVTDPLGLSSQARSMIVPAPPRCPGDANFDGLVGFPDITSILQNFGGAGPDGDSNEDGLVSFADISLTLTNWGRVCP